MALLVVPGELAVMLDDVLKQPHRHEQVDLQRDRGTRSRASFQFANDLEQLRLLRIDGIYAEAVLGVDIDRRHDFSSLRAVGIRPDHGADDSAGRPQSRQPDTAGRRLGSARAEAQLGLFLEGLDGHGAGEVVALVGVAAGGGEKVPL